MIKISILILYITRLEIYLKKKIIFKYVKMNNMTTNKLIKFLNNIKHKNFL